MDDLSEFITHSYDGSRHFLAAEFLQMSCPRPQHSSPKYVRCFSVCYDTWLSTFQSSPCHAPTPSSLPKAPLPVMSRLEPLGNDPAAFYGTGPGKNAPNVAALSRYILRFLRPTAPAVKCPPSAPPHSPPLVHPPPQKLRQVQKGDPSCR